MPTGIARYRDTATETVGEHSDQMAQEQRRFNPDRQLGDRACIAMMHLAGEEGVGRHKATNNLVLQSYSPVKYIQILAYS